MTNSREKFTEQQRRSKALREKTESNIKRTSELVKKSIENLIALQNIVQKIQAKIKEAREEFYQKN